MIPVEKANASAPGPGTGQHPLGTALLGRIESFQLDKSCAMLLLAGAVMAAFGVVVAMVAGKVREVGVTWWVAFLVGVAAVSALVGGWIWRRSRRLGVRPLGLRILAVVNLLFAVAFFTFSAIARGPDDLWRAGVDLLFLGAWLLWAVAFWRTGSGQRRNGDPSPTEEASTPP